MNLTLNIQAETPEEITAAVIKLAATMGTTPFTATDSGKAAPRASKQTTIKPAKPDAKPAEQEAASEPEEPQQDSDCTQDIPDVTALRAAAQEKGKTPEGKKAIKALLVTFESNSISSIPEEKRAEFLAALEAL